MLDLYLGKFIHVFNTDGNIDRQGLVLKKVGRKMYEVQEFSWMTGEPNGRVTMTEACLKHCCRVYPNKEEWLRRGELRFSVRNPNGS